MNSTAEDEVTPRRPPQRLRFELIFVSVGLIFGLFVMPALIYTVGTLLLGPYGENQGLGSFYGDFFRDLVTPAVRAWILALGPLVLVSALRLMFFRLKRDPHEPDAQSPRSPPPPSPPARSRVEPRVTGD